MQPVIVLVLPLEQIVDTNFVEAAAKAVGE